MAVADMWEDAPPVRTEDGQLLNVGGSRLEVVQTRTGLHVWNTQAPPRSVPVPKGEPAVNPSPLPWVTPLYRNVRWSGDGRYLSFTLYDDPSPTVILVDTATWKEVLRIPNAMNAFVLPSAAVNRP
jgi:hypothetical protein